MRTSSWGRAALTSSLHALHSSVLPARRQQHKTRFEKLVQCNSHDTRKQLSFIALVTTEHLHASPVLWFPSSGTSSKLQFSQRRFLESRQSTELSYLIISYWLQLWAFTHLLVHCSPRPRAHTETGIQKEVAGTCSEAAKGVAKLLRAKH